MQQKFLRLLVPLAKGYRRVDILQMLVKEDTIEMAYSLEIVRVEEAGNKAQHVVIQGRIATALARRIC